MILIPVEISLSFAAVFAFSLILDNTGFVPLALVAATLHEIGHMIMLKLLSVQIQKVEFKAFGIKMYISDTSKISYKGEIAVALSGPLLNLILGGLCCLFYFKGFIPSAMFSFTVSSISIGIFNLLPIGALDGGRALSCLFAHFFDPERAVLFHKNISLLFLAPLFAAAIFFLVYTGYNITLLFVSVYLFFGLFLKKKNNILKNG